MILRAPFPWFGGKSRAAHLVWPRFGDVRNYVEPFAGSLAVLLSRPTAAQIETVNDLDCYISNFWRAVQHAPEEVAAYADYPVNEADLHARHQWLVNRVEFTERMKTDPEYFDVKIAGWWVWGVCQWIGSGWCEIPSWSGRTNAGRAARGIHALEMKRPRLGKGGTGVSRRLCRQKPDISGDGGAAGRGVHASARQPLIDWFEALQGRLRRVRVCCGEWDRVLGPAPTTCIGVTAVFLDPPYSAEAGRDASLYRKDSGTVAHQVREWALTNGDNPKLRIALCGYEGEHAMPSSWECVPWKTAGGYGSQRKKNGRNENPSRERIWFSPHCVRPMLPLLEASA